MINISDIVKEVIEEKDIFKESLSEGIANFSSLSRKIKPEVEKRTLKRVDERSITVALSRLSKELLQKDSYFDFKIDSLSVHSNLVEVTLEKTDENISKLKQFYTSLPDKIESYFTITQGINEITVVAENALIELVKQIYGVNFKFHKDNLSGITVKFSLEYLKIPNVIYRIYAKVAAKRINIVEVISTTTEITFIIDRKDTELAVSQLSKLL